MKIIDDTIATQFNDPIKDLFAGGIREIGKATGIIGGQSKADTPIAAPQTIQQVSTVGAKTSLLAEERRKKGLRSTILAGTTDTAPQGGGNTLLG